MANFQLVFLFIPHPSSQVNPGNFQETINNHVLTDKLQRNLMDQKVECTHVNRKGIKSIYPFISIGG